MHPTHNLLNKKHKEYSITDQAAAVMVFARLRL